MTEHVLTEFEKKVDYVVEALRTADGTTVYHALTCAPTENLQHIGMMIQKILSDRNECHCEEPSH